ncbi:MAG: sigma-54 dependent transcriptional regulator [Proteobacteria bacterium]|jgi:two-component system NtrC family response regulator|nr:sigma-54-dependent Fis family transcriptional regulator [Desulfocapsa sp.]MBU3944101.1 sigma-54 dependent transcriptional regulator [Pseudomonadota bacterium]MCG2743970.1 sigma-54 dependent transcriptional regulator [Desulfobacteraceae bacterium]MBU3984186.1 sigma-54 dependent transcriptional regulator [Pseudomonadota bacterium]MBU4029758.1 sigma-54 dependent transcriptional regulator [Pseudomonadota bacterium]
MYSILIVDDEPNYLVILSELLRDEGYEIFTAPGGAQGLVLIQNVDLDMVITDMQMPGMDGLQLLGAIKKINSDLPVVMITAFAQVDKAVAAMQAGAFNYLAKPFSNDELIVTINKAVHHYSLVRENIRLRKEILTRTGFAGMVGKNARMVQVYELIEKVAPTPSSVLITGESGTGKELVAKAIHVNSPRQDKAFITVNCAALAENLLESELFGHEKGAFTGAVAMRKGRFELADGGTLFLDEIGEIPLSLQSKLLRALQEKSFERVGGSKTLSVDVRIISATNKDLKEEVDQGRFREDLYYRLNVIHVLLPPLRERMDDIPILVAYFIKTVSERLAKPGLSISPDALRLLVTLPWEGNVRELENTIERAAILCNNNKIEAEDVQPESTARSPQAAWTHAMDLAQLIPDTVELNEVLYAVEEKMLNRALEASGFVQARAAERLGITKSLLQYKMKKYGIKKGK